MAGVKQFDQNAVLDRAMILFWRRGYEATSVHDLVDAIGINRGSLYATFGDKQRFFLAALDRYLSIVAKSLFAELSDPNPRRAIERMFASIIRRTSDSQFPRGCLLTNTALECTVGGDAIGRKIAEMLGAQESAIYQVLHRAQIEGSLDSRQDPRALARFFMGVAHGMNVVNKAGADPTILRDMAEVAMAAWKPSIPAPRRKSSRSSNRSNKHNLN
jgi:TetR/AcrR family transcriptional repressor of nem operon